MDTDVLGLPEQLRGVGRALVMGVVNVTPDSFSDGGAFLDEVAAVAHGRSLHAAGADLVDIGGESTRPGAMRVSAAEEQRRVLPVVSGLAATGVVVSIDTMRSQVAAAALQAGARLVNDVSGGRADPAMADVVADAGVPYVVMHWRGHSDTMQSRAIYADVVDDVRRELGDRLDSLVAAGVAPEQIVLDPGLGFAKDPDHNWALLARLGDLHALGRPLLVGASRKTFLGELMSDRDADPALPQDRDDATAAVSAFAAAAGAWCVRVHDVRGSAAAVRVAAALRSAR